MVGLLWWFGRTVKEGKEKEEVEEEIKIATASIGERSWRRAANMARWVGERRYAVKQGKRLRTARGVSAYGAPWGRVAKRWRIKGGKQRGGGGGRSSG